MRAYRREMKAIHPDRQNPEQRDRAEELAKQLNAAYATLANSIKRRTYDQSIRGRIVQDEVMSRYVGGFYPAGGAAPDGLGKLIRRQPSAEERRQQVAADRTAFLTLILVFGGFALALMTILVLWGLARFLFQAAS